jgi:putative SOS response-associated peptidase YedK
MCGRFTLTTSGRELAEVFELDEPVELPPRYNIAPGTDVAAIGLDATGTRRTLRPLRWGLVPSWAPDRGIGNRLLLARAETAAVKPAFEESFRHHRCVVPADGFFEWQRRDGARRPWLVRRRDGRPFAIAALYAVWRARAEAGAGGEPERLASCALLTVPANQVVAPIHDRMPALLDPAEVDGWLRARDPASARAMLRPYRDAELTAWPVSQRVNRAEFDAPECLEPVG